MNFPHSSVTSYPTVKKSLELYFALLVTLKNDTNDVFLKTFDIPSTLEVGYWPWTIGHGFWGYQTLQTLLDPFRYNWTLVEQRLYILLDTCRTEVINTTGHF